MPGQARLVGLLGLGGSGKAFVARRLVEVHGFRRLNFDDAVQDALSSAFGFTETDFDNVAKAQPLPRFGGHSLHSLINTLKFEWGRRRIHSDIWTNEFRRRFEALDGHVVCEDLQWENEAAAVRDAGGIIVRIRRPDHRLRERDESAAQRQAGLVHDLELVNEGLEGLCHSVDAFVDGWNQTLAAVAGVEAC